LLIAVAMAAPLIYVRTLSGDDLARTLVGIVVTSATIWVIARLRERLEAGQAELRDLAARDPLTGVGNYRVLHERLDYELEHHRRSQRQLAVLLVDLDRFKQVNERLGHAAGDDILRRVARALTGAVRGHDTVVRQGGDEFAVLAPETDSEGAAMIAARIRDRVARVQFAGESIGATVGFAVYPADGDGSQQLLAQADARLLARKVRDRDAAPGVVVPIDRGAQLSARK
jgi:diguanylate cyclase (GGDEF)-like protein